jgi:tetratricopeptide (TPR) repeat protein
MVSIFKPLTFRSEKYLVMKHIIVLIFLVFSISVFAQSKTKKEEFNRNKNYSEAEIILDSVKSGSLPNDTLRDMILQGISLIEKFKDNESQLLYGNFLHELSWLEYVTSNYAKSIEIELEALKIAQKVQDTTLLIITNYNLGAAYSKIGSEYSKLGVDDERSGFMNIAKHHIKEAVNLSEKQSNLSRYYSSLSALSNFYLSLKQFDSAVYYSNLILEKSPLDNYKVRSGAYNLIGISKYESKNFDEAEKCFLKAIELSAMVSGSMTFLTAKGNLANVYMEKGNYTSAKKLLLELVELNTGRGRLHAVSQNYISLHDIYKREKKYDSSLFYFEKYHIYKDSSLNDEHKSFIKELNIKYETEKKNNEITILTQKDEINNLKIAQQKQSIWLLIIGVVVLLVVGVVVFIYQRKITAMENLTLRSKLTRSQFNPHYINNAFTALQSKLLESDFDESLISYTSHLSRFSRLLLESTFKDEWTLFEEVQMMENYLKTQRFRLEDGFDFNVNHTLSKDDLHAFIIPSALTQTVLENAIEHGGFNASNKGGKITINLTKDNQRIFISIENNMVGERQKLNKKEQNEPSRGLEITKSRIELHSKISKKPANFKLLSHDDKVVVKFELPIVTK